MLGRSLGNYDVVSQIGEGGMGVVYLARHAMLGRAVAIKVLRAARSDGDLVARLFNEARAATAVRHPAIVDVYDVGFLEDRRAYIVMEYLEGESLAARIRRGCATVEATLIIVRAIARALQAVHARGIVHRDLKPDNVFLVPDPETPGRERVKILDFGIAKLREAPGSIGPTVTGTLLGTPIYMSPEQCRGDRTIDHRTDLYALGCVAYEMLCGQPPFAGDAPGDVIARHQYVEPAPLRRVRADVPAGVDRLVLRLLEKRRADRYRSAADVVRAIDGLLAPAAALAGDLLPTLSTTRTATAATRSGKPRPAPQRRRLGVVAGAATAALALLLLLWLRVSSAPVAGGPGAPDDHLSGAEHRARRPERIDPRVALARRLASEAGLPVRLLQYAAHALCGRGRIQPGWWLARGADTLLSRHRGGAFARLIHRIAGAGGAPGDDVVAPLAAAAACLARRHRSLRVARLGVAASGRSRRPATAPARYAVSSERAFAALAATPVGSTADRLPHRQPCGQGGRDADQVPVRPARIDQDCHRVDRVLLWVPYNSDQSLVR
ncbi:MAG TPA: serine/threonine-protein kinase [Kofleriaceae bacterium]|jgi:tRNA A-37 threonylcarbamoyl transferase component Bud32|nr:serine/threonine-protein kinase [Kofleriaceae bacterium]